MLIFLYFFLTCAYFKLAKKREKTNNPLSFH